MHRNKECGEKRDWIDTVRFINKSKLDRFVNKNNRNQQTRTYNILYLSSSTAWVETWGFISLPTFLFLFFPFSVSKNILFFLINLWSLVGRRSTWIEPFEHWSWSLSQRFQACWQSRWREGGRPGSRPSSGSWSYWEQGGNQLGWPDEHLCWQQQMQPERLSCSGRAACLWSAPRGQYQSCKHQPSDCKVCAGSSLCENDDATNVWSAAIIRSKRGKNIWQLSVLSSEDNNNRNVFSC